MTFRETLGRHLQAIQDRNLASLLETVAADGLVVITSDGRLIRSRAEFAALHQSWFEMTTWRLGEEEVELRETPELGVAVLRLDYRDDPPGGQPIRETSLLTLIFALQEGQWRMVHDQNTPVRTAV